MSGNALIIAAALAVGAAAPPSSAQAVRDHRIRVTSPTPRTEIVIVPASRLRAASPAGITVDWLGRDQAPATIEIAAGRDVTILADDIAFRTGSYSLKGASNLTLVARTIRVLGDATFDLSATTSGGRAGSMTILAERFSCAPGAHWRVVANGGTGRNPGQAGGDGGHLLVASDTMITDTSAVGAADSVSRSDVRVGRVIVPSARVSPRAVEHVAVARPVIRAPVAADSVGCITFASSAGRGTGGPVRFRDSAGGWRTRQDPPKHGQPGRLQRLARRADAADQDAVHRALSRWAVEYLLHTRSRMLEAHAGEDHGELIRLFGRYSGFTPVVDVHSAMRAEYDDLRAELNRYRGDVLVPVFPRPIEVRTNGIAQRMHVFTESSPFRNTIAPTHLLAAPVNLSGGSRLGLIEFDPEHPEVLAIELELQLSVDPWLASLAADAAREEGDSIAGMFTGWHLQARPIEEIGVNESRISVLPGGQRMRVRLVIDGRKAGAVFWKLFSGDGIPLVYDWEYRAGDGKPVTSGTWAGPTLSLARRERHEARIENGSIRNSGEAPVVIEYVGLGPTEFFALARAISLAPGDSSPLSVAGLPPDANVDGLWIPPHAVLTMLDPLDVERSFSVLNGDQFIQHITITNLLAAHDERLGGALEYVEVFATVGEEASRDEGRLGPFRLSAAHTTGSEMRVPVLRAGPREDRVTIWGAAFYENGSCQSLPPTTLDSWEVKLTTSMLAANRPAEPPERGEHSLCSK